MGRAMEDRYLEIWKVEYNWRNDRKGDTIMAENMFDIRKSDRRKQIIEENMDVADQILATNPFINTLPEESEIDELQEEVILEEKVDIIEENEIPQKQPMEQENTPVQFKLSLLKREKN